MRRTLLVVAGSGLAVVGGLTTYFLCPSKLPADPPKPTAALNHVAAAPSETSAQLPIGQVVLFSSGVGYFQREGQIDGDARVDLSFPTQDINDLIKSMVLRDLDGGHISAVSYDSNAPVEKTLQSFAVNLSANPTFGQVLESGARREGRSGVAAVQRGPARHDDRRRHGRREAKGRRPARTPVEVEQLNLWCADGMRSVKLADVQRVRFLNPIMDNEVQEGAGDADAVARHAEEGGQPELRRRGQAQRPRRLRHRESDLEDELSPRSRQGEGGQAVLARLGRGRERHR